jgi:hypothetical protein
MQGFSIRCMAALKGNCLLIWAVWVRPSSVMSSHVRTGCHHSQIGQGSAVWMMTAKCPELMVSIGVEVEELFAHETKQFCYYYYMYNLYMTHNIK